MTTVNEPVLQMDAVTKWFGDVVAVSDVTTTLHPGVTGLLGPNGAGKSSLMRMACGLAAPSTGTVRLFGVDPRSDPQVFRRVGFVPQSEALPGGTPTELVRTAALLHGVADPGTATEQALGRVGLHEQKDRPLRQMSGGERQRAKIAQALVHDPELLVMDEPLEGLDPRQRNAAIDLITRLGAEGRSVLVSSHVLEEVERMLAETDEVIVVARGRLVAQGDVRGVRELMDDRPHRVRLMVDDPRALAAVLAQVFHVKRLELAEDSLTLETTDLRALGRDLLPAVRQACCRLTEMVPLDDDLDSVFRYLVAAP